MIYFEFPVRNCEAGLHVSALALVYTSFILPFSSSISSHPFPFQWPYNVATWWCILQL